MSNGAYERKQICRVCEKKGAIISFPKKHDASDRPDREQHFVKENGVIITQYKLS